jgi:hypothetical protein
VAADEAVLGKVLKFFFDCVIRNTLEETLQGTRIIKDKPFLLLVD